MRKRIQRRIDIDSRKTLDAVEPMEDRLLGNLGGAMFVPLPVFALWLKLAYTTSAARSGGSNPAAALCLIAEPAAFRFATAPHVGPAEVSIQGGGIVPLH